MSPRLTEVCDLCGKRKYASWKHAAQDAHRLSLKNQSKLLPYWSRRCQCIHIGDHAWVKRS